MPENLHLYVTGGHLRMYNSATSLNYDKVTKQNRPTKRQGNMGKAHQSQLQPSP